MSSKKQPVVRKPSKKIADQRRAVALLTWLTGQQRRRADPAGVGQADRAARAVAAGPAGPVPQNGARRVAGNHPARGPQPPGPADDRGGRTADPAPGAGRQRWGVAAGPAARAMAGSVTADTS